MVLDCATGHVFVAIWLWPNSWEQTGWPELRTPWRWCYQGARPHISRIIRISVANGPLNDPEGIFRKPFRWSSYSRFDWVHPFLRLVGRRNSDGLLENTVVYSGVTERVNWLNRIKSRLVYFHRCNSLIGRGRIDQLFPPVCTSVSR